MPTERNAWEIDQIKEKLGGVIKKSEKQDDRLHDLETFQASTTERLLIVFAKLEELQEGDRWIKRIFITALIGAVLSGVSALIVWAFTH